MKILLIGNYFPPANTIASHRMYAFAKFLQEEGFEIVVLTPKRQGNLDLDISDIKVIHPIEEQNSINTFSKKTSILKSIFRYTGVRAIRYYLQSKFYQSTKKLVTEIEKQKLDFVLASYPSEDSFRIAYLLYRKLELPYVLDYRDLWIDNSYYDWTFFDRLIIVRLRVECLSALRL